MAISRHALTSATAPGNSIELECLYHSPQGKWAYAYNSTTFHLRLRSKKNNVKRVFALTGDKYDWEHHHQELEMLKVGSDAYFDYWEAEVTPERKRFSYGFRLETDAETVWMVESGFYRKEQPTPPGGYYEMPYIHEVDLLHVPEWAKSAVFYQIMPDRFANGDPANDPEGTLEWGATPANDSFFGGDLQGIIDHLDYIVELGVTALYLTPIFQAPSNHKYDTVDYGTIDSSFGDVELLKQLVSLAHSKGLKVVLDAVFNHTSAEFPPFKDVIEHGAASKYANWFHIYDYPVKAEGDNPNYDTFGFFAGMPKLNTANPETKEYLLDITRFWLSEVQIDGWRLDVANEVDHVFWREFRQAVKEINPEAFIIGEVWSDSLNWLQGDQFDSVMNYPFSDRLLEYFRGEEINPAAFASHIYGLLMRYPRQANEVLFNLLASHDTPRVLTRLGGDTRRLKLTVTFLLTFTGTPCIFYGDEIGLTGEDDPDCRKCMIWEEDRQDRELFSFYQRMIALRKEHKVLRTGHFRFLQSDADSRGLVYDRFDDNSRFTVWMNNSSEPLTLQQSFTGGSWQDAFSGEPVEMDGDGISITLEPLGFRILRSVAEAADDGAKPEN
ncbi:alpha-glycosidase [Paenibacillus sp. FSL P4-0081]|uniref:alpha-glycosidase n=1 Tax=Paenibacillus sp. FSL P4-0081 TaxID=1536769 RepID=UPI0009E0816D|nr:alpha-glycosidase [Paenibacillus sp. FSL P4-0081]